MTWVAQKSNCLMTHLPHACCLLHVAITAVREVVLEMMPWEMSYAKHNLKIGIF